MSNIYKKNFIHSDKMFTPKRGLSAIVATLIVVLLAIVAFGIISNFVLDEAEGQIDESGYNLDCQDVRFDGVSAVNSSSAGVYNITVDRASDSGEAIDGYKASLINSENTESETATVEQEITPLDLKTSSAKFTNNTALGFNPATLEVVPYFEKENGENFVCQNGATSQDITN